MHTTSLGSAQGTGSTQIVSLEWHGRTFLEQMERQGYAAATVRVYGRTINRLIDVMRQGGLSAADLHGRRIEDLKTLVQNLSPQSARRYTPFCLDQFCSYLIDIGAAPPPAPPAVDETAKGQLRRAYEDYLRNQRGLSDATIRHCLGFFERFLAFRFGGELGDLDAITPDDIAAFLHRLTDRKEPFRDKTPPTHLRSLFTFLFWSGKTRRNLAASIPRMAHGRGADLPRYLTQEQVQKLIDAARSDDAIGRRNHAMLLLIARLGLRAAEVVAIQLDDIKWRTGEILIRGKGNRHERMPLPQDAGKALVDYIKNARKGDSRTLFVTSNAPYRPLVNGEIVNSVLRQAFAKTGLKPPAAYVGSHVLRHSLATHMLQHGASLTEIGDVLRHRSRMSTTIYAKYDIDALRSIALPWPVTGGAQ